MVIFSIYFSKASSQALSLKTKTFLLIDFIDNLDLSKDKLF